MRERARRKEAGRPEARGVRGGGRGYRFAMQILARELWRAPRGAGGCLQNRGSRGSQPTPSLSPHYHPPTLPPTQDAAGPPGPLYAGPAARLRLAGAPVCEHPGRAGPPGTSCAVDAPAGQPQARTTRSCPRAPVRTYPGQDQGASGGVSARSGWHSLAGGVGSFCFLYCCALDAWVLLTGWGGGAKWEVEGATESCAEREENLSSLNLVMVWGRESVQSREGPDLWDLVIPYKRRESRWDPDCGLVTLKT